jgi:CRP-like cAMP-binding protein
VSATTVSFARPAPEPDDPRHGGVDLAFRNPRLARLLISCGLAQVAEWAVVTSFAIYVVGHHGLLALGFVGFRAIPGAISGVLLSPFWSARRGALTSIALARTCVLAVAALGVMADVSVVAVLALVALDAVVAGPYRPAQGRVVPYLTREPAEVVGTSAGMSMMRSAGQAGGGLAGGLLAAVIAPQAVMLGGAGAMALAGVVALGLTVPAGHRPMHWLARLREAVGDLLPALTHRDASSLVWAGIARTLVRGLWTALAIVVALRLFHLGESGVGMLQGAAGVGALIGIPLTTTLIGRTRLGGPCAAAFVAAGLTISAIGVFDLGRAVAIVIVVWGVAMAVADATCLSLLHRLLPSAVLGRVVEVLESLKVGAEGIGALCAPLLVSLLGTKTALILAGLPLPAIVLAGLPQIRRSDAQAAGRSALVRLLHRVRVLRGLDMPALEEVAASVEPLHAAAGDSVVRQGDVGDRFYVIAEGEAEVLVGGFPVAHLHRGHGFGERALLRDSPRTATVRGVTDLRLYALDRDDFLAAMTGQRPDEAETGASRPAQAADVLDRPLAEVLGDLSQLHGAPRDVLERLARASRAEAWEPGAPIVREGDAADCVHVVLAGRAEVTAGGRVVNAVHPGDVFGEISVLHRTPRTATVTATEPTTTCRVPADAFRAAATVQA